MVAGRADQSVVAYRDVAITLRVDPALVPFVASLPPGNGVSGSLPQGGNALNITATGAWTVAATAPWITLSAASGTGNGVVNVGFNPAGLAAGTYTGEVVINGPNGVTQRIQVSFTVVLPTLSAGGPITLGGVNGRDLRPAGVPLQLNTVSNSFPWTVSGVPGWLQISQSSGTVSSTPAPIAITPLRSGAAAGTQSAQLTFTATVNGQAISTSVTVSLNLDDHRLLGSRSAIGFVSSPDWTSTGGAFRVRSNLGATVALTASTNQSWLTAMPVSEPGTFNVFANPAGLAPGQVYRGTVTVSSTDPTVVAPARLEVALWVSGTPAGGLKAVPSSLDGRFVADPMRPYLYAHNGSGDVVTFNMYTGAEVGRTAAVASSLGGMAISPDGSALYVTDPAQRRVYAIDLATRAVTTSWAARPVPPLTPVPPPFDRVAAFRANGRDFLMASNGEYFQLPAGTPIAVSQDQVGASYFGPGLATGARGGDALFGLDGTFVVRVRPDFGRFSNGGLLLTRTAIHSGFLSTTPSEVIHEPERGRVLVRGPWITQLDENSLVSAGTLWPPVTPSGASVSNFAVGPFGKLWFYTLDSGDTRELWSQDGTAAAIPRVTVGEPNTYDMALSGDGAISALKVLASTPQWQIKLVPHGP